MAHDFRERLAFSEGIRPGDALMDAIMGMVPNATELIRAKESDDREGTDFWIRRTHGLPPLSMDMKNRSFCPILKFGRDDVCIETTSVYRGEKPWCDQGRIKPGWSVDYRKRTDYIVYTWPNEAGTRFWIVPFVPLCTASRKYWREWAREYGERGAANKTYTTLSVYVPRVIVERAIRTFMQGIA